MDTWAPAEIFVGGGKSKKAPNIEKKVAKRPSHGGKGPPISEKHFFLFMRAAIAYSCPLAGAHEWTVVIAVNLQKMLRIFVISMFVRNYAGNFK